MKQKIIISIGMLIVIISIISLTILTNIPPPLICLLGIIIGGVIATILDIEYGFKTKSLGG